MDPAEAIELGRQAMFTAMLLGAPVLLVGMAIALVIGLLQAITQVQDQTVSFVPKLVAMVLALTFALPWILAQFLQYSSELISNIPNRL